MTELREYAMTNQERKIRLQFLIGLILGLSLGLLACEVRHFLE